MAIITISRGSYSRGKEIAEKNDNMVYHGLAGHFFLTGVSHTRFSRP